jgi:hypothetical protein
MKMAHFQWLIFFLNCTGVHTQPKANILTRNQKGILRARHRHERDIVF